MAGFCPILLVSCKKEDSPDTVDCTGLTPTYTSDIKAILDAQPPRDDDGLVAGDDGDEQDREGQRLGRGGAEGSRRHDAGQHRRAAQDEVGPAAQREGTGRGR